MPRTEVRFYLGENGAAPVFEWLRDLLRTNRHAFAACFDKILLLAEKGHELRRPHADYLDGGIYELRAKSGRVQYRLLYAFHGRHLAVLAHATTKEAKVPPADIRRAKERMQRFAAAPDAHTFEVDLQAFRRPEEDENGEE